MTVNIQTKRLLVNLAMLIVVAALAVVVILDPLGSTDPLPPTTRIADRDPDDVRRIVLDPADRPRLVLERRSDGWMVIEPVEVEAGPARIMQVMDLLTAESRGRFPADGVDAATSGLDAPRLVVHFDDEVIALGKINPLTNRRYAQVNNGDVHVIDETRVAFIAPAFAAYVSPRLLSSDAKLSGIEIGGRVIERNRDGNWQVTDGPALDGPAIIALVDAWQNATALSAEPLRDEPANGEAVVLRLVDGRNLRFIVLAREPEIVLARADIGIRYNLPDLFATGLFPAN